ncbi:hypothetical protein [Spirosoma endbachense]|uniref:Uncharacterized protein n=1 Tax=Spirosoma endbachense TaxID=2666025 RepID=A0A6P1W1T6_9BACT|nr:hypothetical protein [Spirosoma endbachense]QHV98272.1 hypothetical protein GJR95_26175 [Spirosoma endbachense]
MKSYILKLLLCILTLLPTLIYGQQKTSPNPVKSVKGLPEGTDSILVEYATLMKIARKYGLENNWSFTPTAGNPRGKSPKRIFLKMSLE